MFGLALFLPRVISFYLMPYQLWPVRTDPGAYEYLARSILAGQGLRIDLHNYFGMTASFYPPLYPSILAAVSLFSQSNIGVAVAAVNILSDAATAYTVFLIAKECNDPRAGRAAAWLYLLWPNIVFGAFVAQKESLAVLLSAQLAWFFLRLNCGGASRKLNRLGVGLMTGLLALTQPGWASMVVLFGAVLLARNGIVDTVRDAVPAGAVATFVMTPWWVRNWYVHGTFVPLTTASGHSMRVALTGVFSPLPSDVVHMTEAQRSAEIGRRALSAILEHPVSFVAGQIGRIRSAFTYDIFSAVRLRWIIHPPPEQVIWVLQLTNQIVYLQIVALAAASIVFRRRKIFGVASLGMFLFLVHSITFGIPFEFSERHRYFVNPLTALLAGCTISAIVMLMYPRVVLRGSSIPERSRETIG